MTSRENRGARMSAGDGLRSACHQAQAQLDGAISGVLTAEQQLRDNVREVRAELQSCVSRQQEALRCREVWLLDQIELLQQVKTETLQQQLQQLHRLRGQFDVLTHLLQNNNNNKDLSNQLTVCMEKLSSLSLTPEETPEVSFHGDARALRNAITSFGSINAQLVEGVSSPDRAQVHNYPITAKQQAPEGAALSDWLLATPSPCPPAVGHQANKNPQDWLMSPSKESQTRGPAPAPAPVDFLQAWGQLRDLEAWLLREQAPLGRARSVSGSSSAFSFEEIDESELAVAPDEAERELSDWLLTPPVAMETDAERWQQVFKPFSAGWASSDWLAEPRPAAPADCSSCCQTRIPAVEIENLGQLKCLKPPPPTPTATSAPTPPDAAPALLEAWLQQTAPSQKSCKANELCSSYSDCVCEGSCGRDALNAWLLQQDGRDKNGVPLGKNTPAPDHDDNSEKAPPTAEKAPPTAEKAPPLTKSAPSLYDRHRKVHAIWEAWLQPPAPFSPSPYSSPATPPSQPLTPPLADWLAPDAEKAQREEPAGRQEDKWLLKKSQAQERLMLPVVCDLFSCMNMGGDKEKWLHRSPVQM